MAKKQVIIRLNEEVSDQLKIYVIQHKTSVQELLEKYIIKILKDTTPEPPSSHD